MTQPRFPTLSAEQIAALRKAGSRIYDGLEFFEVHAGWYELLIELTGKLETEVAADVAGRRILNLVGGHLPICVMPMPINLTFVHDDDDGDRLYYKALRDELVESAVLAPSVGLVEKCDLRALQVKTKLGGLRVYLSRYPGKTYELIGDAEQRSIRTCEACGQPGARVRTPRGWIWTACESHRPDGAPYT